MRTYDETWGDRESAVRGEMPQPSSRTDVEGEMSLKRGVEGVEMCAAKRGAMRQRTVQHVHQPWSYDVIVPLLSSRVQRRGSGGKNATCASRAPRPVRAQHRGGLPDSILGPVDGHLDFRRRLVDEAQVLLRQLLRKELKGFCALRVSCNRKHVMDMAEVSPDEVCEARCKWPAWRQRDP